MSDIAQEPINKRIVFIGDYKTGKTSIVSAFTESYPSRKGEANSATESAAQENSSSENNKVESKSGETTENGTVPDAKENNKNEESQKKEKEEAKKEEIDSDSESEDSDREDPKLLADIDALLVYASLKHENQTYELAIWDTPDEKDFKKNRATVYAKADALVLIYSVDSRESFKNAGKKWKNHLKKNLKKNKKCPVILVGNKLDLRIKTSEDEESDEDDEKQSVSTEEGKKLAKKIGAIEFLECSAINKEGIREIFEKAATYTNTEVPKSSKCIIT